LISQAQMKIIVVLCSHADTYIKLEVAKVQHKSGIRCFLNLF
jgi:hypothetical protein